MKVINEKEKLQTKKVFLELPPPHHRSRLNFNHLTKLNILGFNIFQLYFGREVMLTDTTPRRKNVLIKTCDKLALVFSSNNYQEARVNS